MNNVYTPTREDLFCTDLPTRPVPGVGKILITGASGYIGGRLVNELLARGYQVRVIIRENATHYQELWPQAEVVVADALKYETLQHALNQIDTAFYLIHSLLLGQHQFYDADITAAHNFREAARKIMLSGLFIWAGWEMLQLCYLIICAAESMYPRNYRKARSRLRFSGPPPSWDREARPMRL